MDRNVTARCSSCGAAIVWAFMSSGKRMPLDAKPQKLITLIPNPAVLADAPVGHVVDCYTSHFVTCPNAAQHRKPR
jgi:hypothetical protein